MVLEVTVGAVLAQLVWTAMFGAGSWFLWRQASRETGRWYRRLSPYAASGLMAWFAVVGFVMVAGAPFIVVAVSLGCTVVVLLVARLIEVGFSARDADAERDRLVRAGEPVPDRLLSPALAAVTGFVYVGLLGFLMVSLLLLVGGWLASPVQQGSALLYQQELVAAATVAATMISMVAMFAAPVAAAVAYWVQRYRRQRAAERFALALEWFELRLANEREAAITAAPILQNA